MTGRGGEGQRREGEGKFRAASNAKPESTSFKGLWFPAFTSSFLLDKKRLKSDEF